MHEWALAESIIRAVEAYAAENKLSKVRLVKVYLGELQAIDAEVLGFALQQLRGEAAVEIEEIKLLSEEAVFRCNRCGHEWRLSDIELDEAAREAIHFVPEVMHTYIKCPRCGSTDYTVVSGRGIRIEIE